MKNQLRALGIAILVFVGFRTSAQNLPLITLQPQSQAVPPGSNVTFLVSANPELPVVSSGTQQLWLKADAGVILDTNNGTDTVAEWDDQSGNANNAYQTNASLQPILECPSAIGGGGGHPV
jgi:hypothetical protein